ncbi:MAG TPA: DUF4147 domain-containing protein [Candidatus Kryptonia bacterium]|nr:DUF4147 domain-containing protein [Candidatus Kryptonia bacterium]
MTNARTGSSAPPTSTKKTADPSTRGLRAARRSLIGLFTAAVRAVDPAALIAERLRRHHGRLIVTDSAVSWSGRTIIVGGGKASPRMATAAAEVVGADLIAGAVIAPHDGIAETPKVSCLEGGHPLPTAAGERSTRALVDVLERHPTAAVLALISGGASSLMVQPTPPLTLMDKVAVNRALLASGADIHEFNTVRKHLSQIKGGGLVRHARGRPLTALIISDVVGDDPETIGSGPTAPDPTTFDDAIDVLKRYSLFDTVPRPVVEVLERGRRGDLRETLKPGAPELAGVTNIVIGSNRVALEAAAVAARTAGYEPMIRGEPLSGDTGAAAHEFAAWVRDARSSRTPLCWLAGGETTVRLDSDTGKGGRNQEFALVCAADLAGLDIQLLSAGTDGIDGPTDAAGAFVDGTTIERARRTGLDHRTALSRHETYAYFDALGDLFLSGPTGTNVMDIKIALAGHRS